MLSGNTCIKCSGIGAMLDVNGQCACAAFASLNNEGVCECNDNYKKSKERLSLRKLKTHNYIIRSASEVTFSTFPVDKVLKASISENRN